MKHISVFPDNASFDAVKSKLAKPYVALVKSNDIVFYGAEQASTPISVTVVDLGLPSGTKWMSMNLNATSPEDPGMLCAFGALKGVRINTDKYNSQMNIDYLRFALSYEYYREQNPIISPSYEEIASDDEYCTYCSGDSIEPYIWDETVEGMVPNPDFVFLDDNYCLVPEYDVITHTYGSEYCMPTREQLNELCLIIYDYGASEEYKNYPDYEVECMNGYIEEKFVSHGVDIYKITSKLTGASLIIPLCSSSHQGYGDRDRALFGYWSKQAIDYDLSHGYAGYDFDGLDGISEGIYGDVLFPIRGVEKQ